MVQSRLLLKNCESCQIDCITPGQCCEPCMILATLAHHPGLYPAGRVGGSCNQGCGESWWCDLPGCCGGPGCLLHLLGPGTCLQGVSVVFGSDLCSAPALLCGQVECWAGCPLLQCALSDFLSCFSLPPVAQAYSCEGSWVLCGVRVLDSSHADRAGAHYTHIGTGYSPCLHVKANQSMRLCTAKPC